MIGSFAARMKASELPYEVGVTTFSKGCVSVGEEGFVNVWVNAGALDYATGNTDGLEAGSVIVVLPGPGKATAVDLERDAA